MQSLQLMFWWNQKGLFCYCWLSIIDPVCLRLRCLTPTRQRWAYRKLGVVGWQARHPHLWGGWRRNRTRQKLTFGAVAKDLSQARGVLWSEGVPPELDWTEVRALAFSPSCQADISCRLPQGGDIGLGEATPFGWGLEKWMPGPWGEILGMNHHMHSSQGLTPVGPLGIIISPHLETMPPEFSWVLTCRSFKRKTSVVNNSFCDGGCS